MVPGGGGGGGGMSRPDGAWGESQLHSVSQLMLRLGRHAYLTPALVSCTLSAWYPP